MRERDAAMALPALKFEPEDPVEERLARVETKVENIQSDITGMKTDIRRLDNKIDALDQKLTGKIEEVDKRLGGKMDSGFDALKAAIADLRIGRANDRVWWLMIAAALLGVMAHGFKWI